VPPTGDPSTQAVATPPMSPSATGDGTGKSGKTKRRPVRGGSKVAATPPTPVAVPTPGAAGKKKKATDGVIVPPISVLVVDGEYEWNMIEWECRLMSRTDNPINQTILSTFMRRKKIKYDVAKNGEEAVQKWKTGGFHLILVSPISPPRCSSRPLKCIVRWTSRCLSWTVSRRPKRSVFSRKHMVHYSLVLQSPSKSKLAERPPPTPRRPQHRTAPA
jgi:hypothetical protein